jgi:hypothetical protein
MSKLPVAGILILILLVVSGYVSSEPTDLADEVANEGPVVSIDPHVNYYARYLISMEVSQPAR